MTKVLVVDDERKMRRLLQILLERMGIDSVAAESGEEALRCFQAEKIDLILTDLKMPGMTGLELLAKLRELDADVPVILLTAFATAPNAVDAMKPGPLAYVLTLCDPAAPASSCRSTAPPSPPTSWRASSSATPGAPSPARRATAPASSSSPTAARCSSTRSGTWPIHCRRSCCASCRRA